MRNMTEQPNDHTVDVSARALREALKREFGISPTKALLKSAKNGLSEGVVVALAAGADINATTPVLGSTALLLASWQGHNKTVELLLERGADIDATNRFGNTALQLASLNSHTSTAAVLVSKGADIHVTNMFGSSAMDIARNAGCRQIRELLDRASLRDRPMPDDPEVRVSERALKVVFGKLAGTLIKASTPAKTKDRALAL